MARPKVTLRSAGMRELLNSSAVRSELTRRAGAVLAAAQASAPVDTGQYRDSLRIIQATTDRAVVRVGSNAPYGYVVAARTGHLARALDAAGGA